MFSFSFSLLPFLRRMVLRSYIIFFYFIFLRLTDATHGDYLIGPYNAGPNLPPAPSTPALITPFSNCKDYENDKKIYFKRVFESLDEYKRQCVYISMVYSRIRRHTTFPKCALFHLKMALLTPAPLTPALINATCKNNAE